jgi:hypothetical protein
MSHGYMMPRRSIGAFGLGIMAGALSLEHGDVETLWTLVGVSSGRARPRSQSPRHLLNYCRVRPREAYIIIRCTPMIITSITGTT